MLVGPADGVIVVVVPDQRIGAEDVWKTVVFELPLLVCIIAEIPGFMATTNIPSGLLYE